MDIQRFGNHAVVTLTQEQLNKAFLDLRRLVQMAEDGTRVGSLPLDDPQRTAYGNATILLEQLERHINR